jgi:hypothetical protein
MRRVSEDMNDEHRYDDLLDLPHHVSKNHKQMPLRDRAAQFAPFAALTGYNESIMDAERKPVEKKELSETQSEELNEKIAFLAEHAYMHPEITVCYYDLETEKEHVKILPKEKKSTKKSSRQKQLADMAKETAVRRAAKGKSVPIGCYATERKQLKQVDAVHQCMIFTDRTEIAFDDLASIDSDLFTQWQAE